jgi:TPP-dependent pyruvate/acetoin dehydrogenase alpha subunit
MDVMTREEMDQLKERVLFEIREGIAFAEASPNPAADQLMEDVYTVAGGPR